METTVFPRQVESIDIAREKKIQLMGSGAILNP
jgi:hypothetical protein